MNVEGVLAAVEAAYEVDEPITSWSRRLLDSMLAAVPGALGGFAGRFQLESARRVRFDEESAVCRGLAREGADALLREARTSVGEVLAEVSIGSEGGVHCVLGSELDLGLRSRQGDTAHGIEDDLRLITLGADGEGWSFGVALPAPSRFAPGAQQSLIRLGRHVAAGQRLRERLARAEGVPPGTGSPLLAGAATLPPEGIEALTSAERTVVGHAARGLSTKEIAYTLGISDTTVRVLLMRAARRCGVKDRRELMALCAVRRAGERVDPGHR